METIRITTSQNVDIDYELAGLGERIAARLIDLAMFIVLGLILLVIIFGLSSMSTDDYVVITIFVVFLCIYGFYDLVCELTMNGQSVGKRFLKIRVISDDGAQPSLGKYLLRWLFRIIDFTFTSEACALISVAVTNKKQRLGDIVAGTIVIKTSPRTAMQDIAFIPEQEDYTPVYRDVLLLKDREIELIHEVILTYMQNRNPEIVFAMAARIKNHLNIAQMEGMHELAFLQTLIKDYNHLTSKA